MSSVYVHDVRKSPSGNEEQAGWVLQAVISRARFRRTPRGGKPHFTMMSLHFNNLYAKKHGVAKTILFAIRATMQEQDVDMVAGDFNGAAWRNIPGSDQFNSTIDEVFAGTNVLILDSSRSMVRCMWIRQAAQHGT